MVILSDIKSVFKGFKCLSVKYKFMLCIFKLKVENANIADLTKDQDF